MMNKFHYIYFALLVVLLSTACNNVDVSSAIDVNENADIFPDYTSTTFPCNIAPPDFIIKNKAEHYFVKISSENGREINLTSQDGNIQIPLIEWNSFLRANTSKNYSTDIYISNNGKWNHLNTITNTISSDSIDSYLVYRFINSANILWRAMGIYQRNIENFDVTPIMDNALTDNNCMHCHSFAANNPENFMLHMRGKPGGTVIYSNHQLRFVDTKTDHTISPGGYPAWHPNGKLIAFSTNKISQRFHAAKEKYAFVYDSKSDIVLYNVEKNQIEAIPALASKDFENIPTWSPDGKYLYYLCAPDHLPDTINYMDIKYSLKRISYNVNTNQWGEIEDIINADSIGKSIAFPRVSPDNRYIVFCMADYGYFTVYNETSDIAFIDLKTRQIQKPDINSEYVESYPSWSLNGKWILFNSKRADGISSRPYFAHFENGKVAKPFLLPQKDAMWNFEELNNINRPELVKSKVMLNPQEILKLVQHEPGKVGFDESSLTKVVVKDSVTNTKNDGSFNFDQ